MNIFCLCVQPAMFSHLKTPYLAGACLLIFTPGRIVYTINRCRVPLINRYIGVRQGNVFSDR